MMHCIHTFVAQNSFYKKGYTIYTYIYIYIIYMCFFMHLDVFVMGKISFKKTQPSGNKSQVRFNIRSLPKE